MTKNPQAQPPYSAKLIFRNDADEAIPPYAIIRITNGIRIDKGHKILVAKKSDATARRDLFYFNGETKVPVGKTGECFVPKIPQWVQWEGEEAPQFGEDWGPDEVDGSWKISKEGTGVFIVGPTVEESYEGGTIKRVKAIVDVTQSVVCDFIRFTILDADCDEGTALVSVDGRPCGCDSVEGEDEYGELEVVDVLGCLLDVGEDEDGNSLMIGLSGYAKYVEDAVTGYCQWEIINMCPYQEECIE